MWDLGGLAEGGPFEIEVTTMVANNTTPFNVYESEARIAVGTADTELETQNDERRVMGQMGCILLLPFMWKR